MTRFPRYREKGYGLLFAAFAVFAIVSAAKDMFPLDLGNGPLWTKIFVIVFMTCWYGLGVVFALYGLSWLQTIEIDRKEIRICFGRLVVRRIPLEQVKTVGVAAMYGRSSVYLLQLVLSEYDRYALNEKGEKYLKRRSTRKWMTQAGVSVEGRDAAARACLFESWKGILLRLEWTEQAEETLRRYLPGKVFLLDRD